MCSACIRPPDIMYHRPILPVILDQPYIHLKNQVIKAERRVLKELGFSVHIKHPHKIIVMYLQVLNYEKNQNLMQFSWNYMNDSLRTDVFVRYQPETVACACIYLTARKLRIPLPKTPAWYTLFGVTEEQIHDVCFRILRLYNRPKVNVEALEKKVDELGKKYQEAKLKARGGSGSNTPSNNSPASPGGAGKTTGAHNAWGGFISRSGFHAPSTTTTNASHKHSPLSPSNPSNHSSPNNTNQPSNGQTNQNSSSTNKHTNNNQTSSNTAQQSSSSATTANRNSKGASDNRRDDRDRDRDRDRDGRDNRDDRLSRKRSRTRSPAPAGGKGRYKKSATNAGAGERDRDRGRDRDGRRRSYSRSRSPTPVKNSTTGNSRKIKDKRRSSRSPSNDRENNRSNSTNKYERYDSKYDSKYDSSSKYDSKSDSKYHSNSSNNKYRINSSSNSRSDRDRSKDRSSKDSRRR